MSNNSLNKIPNWDGKAKSFGVYGSTIQAYAEFIDIRNAMDLILMDYCPTWSEFAAIDIAKPDNHAGSRSHGMALLSKTKSDDYPNGLAWEFVSKAKKANKPSDASTVIKL